MHSIEQDKCRIIETPASQRSALRWPLAGGTIFCLRVAEKRAIVNLEKERVAPIREEQRKDQRKPLNHLFGKSESEVDASTIS